MPKIREHNEQNALILDECYRETLTRVRPYVLEMTSAEGAELCRVWLQKLNAASSQRRLRNEYLLELYRQLKTGRIQGIFSRPPSNGLLLPLPKPHHMICISSSISDLSDCAMKFHRDRLRPSTKCIQHRRGNVLPKHRMMDMTSTNRVRYHNQNYQKKYQIKKYELRVDLLGTLITELQAQNEYLKDQLLGHWEKRDTDDHLSASISQLTADVSSLKAKLTDVQKLKNCLEESCKETIQDYHYSVLEQCTKLKNQLAEEKVKSEKLDNSIAMINEKLEEIIHGKDKEIKEMQKEWMDKVDVIFERINAFARKKDEELQLKQDLIEKKDIELLKKDAERKEEIELLTNKIYDLEAKLEAKIKDEDRLRAMLVEQYNMMKEEFSKMRNGIDHESQKQNQIKVSVLKKTVAELEKSKEKLEHDYEKKMSHIIKNKDMEIKALKLRLQEQKNELCTALNTKKQSEVNNVLNLLEKRYKMILAETEAMTETQTQEYLRKIAVLENQVLHMKTI